jgi:hypothetical protein
MLDADRHNVASVELPPIRACDDGLAPPALALISVTLIAPVVAAFRIDTPAALPMSNDTTSVFVTP